MPGIAEHAVELAIFGSLGAFGGFASYLRKALREDKGFEPRAFMIDVFLAFFVGATSAMYVAPDDPKRVFYAMFFGYFTAPILGLADSQGTRIAERIKHLLNGP